MPWHLEEQWQFVEKHVREYSADYTIGKFRGLDGPLPPMDPSRARSGPLTSPPPPSSKTERTTMVNAINDALGVALEKNPKAVLYGQDVGFGGVFRCSVGLRDRFSTGAQARTSHFGDLLCIPEQDMHRFSCLKETFVQATLPPLRGGGKTESPLTEDCQPP